PDEELREDEGANLRGMKRGSTTSCPAGKRLRRVHTQPDAERREAFRLGFADDRITRRKRHVVSGFRQGTCERQQRSVVTRQRSAGQERAHRTTLSRARSADAARMRTRRPGKPRANGTNDRSRGIAGEREEVLLVAASTPVRELLPTPRPAL